MLFDDFYFRMNMDWLESEQLCFSLSLKHRKDSFRLAQEKGLTKGASCKSDQAEQVAKSHIHLLSYDRR